MPDPAKIRYFRSATALRRWFAKNHSTADELWLGYYKKATGQASVTWPESVDEALCVGWIDGIRKSIDEQRYCIRFTPRRAKSIWSAVNIARATALAAEGRLLDAGRAAFEARDEARSERYSYERENARLDPVYERKFRRAKTAWQYFRNMAPSSRKASIVWVMSAKREATRQRRLAQLIECSAQEKKIPAIDWKKPGT